MTDAAPAAVVVLAAGEGTRMRSAHPEGAARDRRAQPARARAGRAPARSAPDHLARRGRATAATQVAAHLGRRSPRTPRRSCRTSSAAPATPSGCALEALPGPRRAPSWSSAATPRCSRAETLAALVAEHAEARRRRHRAHRRRRRPDRLRPDRPRRRRRRSTAIVEERDADRRSSGRSPRSTPGSTPSTRPRCGTRWAGSAPTTPGRGVPHRRRRPAARRRAARSARADRRATPSRPLGVNDRVQLAAAAARAAATGSLDGLDARRGHGRRPGDDLDRRRRRRSRPT